MKTLLILNDPPYGTERTYNGLRVALSLVKNDPDAHVAVFLMADAVGAARAGQRTPQGFYNIGNMLERVLAGKGRILLCGTCMDARGMTQGDLIEGAARSTMDELAAEVLAAEKVLVF